MCAVEVVLLRMAGIWYCAFALVLRMLVACVIWFVVCFVCLLFDMFCLMLEL